VFLARINPALLEKLQRKLNLSQRGVYARIDKVALAHTQPKNIAALIVAREAGVNFFRFASPEELAAMQKIRNHVELQPTVSVPVAAGGPAQPFRKRKPMTTKASKKKADAVFVVHGRNERARKELSVFLRSLHVDVIEWNKALTLTKKGSPYIGEVIDAGFDHAQAIVVLLTPDDEAKLRDAFIRSSDPQFERKLTGQPRQNVLFEAGMAFGKYKDTTILVQVGKVRAMSDVSGVHIVHLTGSMSSRQQLIGKLKTTGVKLDDSGADWTTAGDFGAF
jgi:predicted nucleotide-binding protein